jgi:hypothetical protein
VIVDADALEQLDNAQLSIIINSPFGYLATCRANAATILQRRLHESSIDSGSSNNDDPSYINCANGSIGYC